MMASERSELITSKSVMAVLRRKDFIALGSCAIIVDASRGLLYPTMWLLVMQFGGGLRDQGTAVGLFSLGRIVASPFLGLLSERRGFKSTLVLGNSLVVFGCLLYIHASSLRELFIAQLVMGCGSGTLGVTRAYIAEATASSDRTKFLALLTALQFSAFSVMPVLGSMLAVAGESLTLGAVFLACSAALAAVGAMWGVPADATEAFAASTLPSCVAHAGYDAVATSPPSLHGDNGNDNANDDIGLTAVERSGKTGGAGGGAGEATSATSQLGGGGGEEGGCLQGPSPTVRLSQSSASVTTILLACLANMAIKGSAALFERLGWGFARVNLHWTVTQTGATFAALSVSGVVVLACVGPMLHAVRGGAQGKLILRIPRMVRDRDKDTDTDMCMDGGGGSEGGGGAEKVLLGIGLGVVLLGLAVGWAVLVAGCGLDSCSRTGGAESEGSSSSSSSSGSGSGWATWLFISALALVYSAGYPLAEAALLGWFSLKIEKIDRQRPQTQTHAQAQAQAQETKPQRVAMGIVTAAGYLGAALVPMLVAARG